MFSNMTMRTTISMPDEIWASVEAQQRDTGASVSEIVRRALVAYFGKANGNGKAKHTVTKRAARPVSKATKTTRASRPEKRVTKRAVKA